MDDDATDQAVTEGGSAGGLLVEEPLSEEVVTGEEALARDTSTRGDLVSVGMEGALPPADGN
jgi:hypothetical protein